VAGNGQPKDMAARALLRKLGAEGLIALPPPVRSANNAFRHRTVAAVSTEQTPLSGPLGALRPLTLSLVHQAEERQLFRALVQRYHYLGYTGPVGENLHYLVYDRHGRALGCLLFGAPAWTMAARERFIGWDRASRELGLRLVANNMRFLILPWVEVAHLASHILGRIAPSASAPTGRPSMPIPWCCSRPPSNENASPARATARRTGSASGRPPGAAATTATSG